MSKYILVNDEDDITDEKILASCEETIKRDDIYEHKRRVIAIGDIHGDLEALLVLLEEVAQVVKFSCNIRDNRNFNEYVEFEWTGGDTYVVIVGDIVDRKRCGSMMDQNGILIGEVPNEENKIFTILNRLALEADKYDGKLIKLIGNHEVMNINGHYKYVSKLGLRYSRKRHPGSLFARKIIGCGTLGIVKIGDWIFVHGGLLPALVKAVRESGITQINGFIRGANNIAQKMFLNELNGDYCENELMKKYFLSNTLSKKENIRKSKDKELEDLFERRDSLLNERRLSLDSYAGVQVPVRSVCDALRTAFKLLGYSEDSRIVVAHSVQLERGLRVRNTLDQENNFVSGYVLKKLILNEDKRMVYSGKGVKYKENIDNTDHNIFPHGLNYECPFKNNDSGQIWRIDTGVSRGFDTFGLKQFEPDVLKKVLRARRPSALEILYDGKNYKTNVIVAKRGLTRNWTNIDDCGLIF